MKKTKKQSVAAWVQGEDGFWRERGEVERPVPTEVAKTLEELSAYFPPDANGREIRNANTAQKEVVY
jgi:hypothetical protein